MLIHAKHHLPDTLGCSSYAPKSAMLTSKAATQSANGSPSHNCFDQTRRAYSLNQRLPSVLASPSSGMHLAEVGKGLNEAAVAT